MHAEELDPEIGLILEDHEQEHDNATIESHEGLEAACRDAPEESAREVREAAAILASRIQHAQEATVFDIVADHVGDIDEPVVDSVLNMALADDVDGVPQG